MSGFKYRIRYERIGSDKCMIPCVTDIYGVSALGALNSFHRFIQLSDELDSNKNVMRPMLRPDGYKLLSIALIYSASTSGKIGSEMIESAFDLPPNPTNPNLIEKTAKPQENFMDFMDKLPEGRLAL